MLWQFQFGWHPVPLFLLLNCSGLFSFPVFHTGSGTARITSDPVTLDTWVTIDIQRIGRDTEMRVTGQRSVYGILWILCNYVYKSVWYAGGKQMDSWSKGSWPEPCCRQCAVSLGNALFILQLSLSAQGLYWGSYLRYGWLFSPIF